MLFRYEDLPDLRKLDPFNENKIVLTLGCFDVPHMGYIDCVNYAKGRVSQLGGLGLVLVGVWGDSFVRRVKGDGRPVRTAEDRAAFMSAIKGVDVAFVMPDTHESRLMGAVQAIEHAQPDMFILGGETSVEEGEFFLRSGRKVRIENDPTYANKRDSSTAILNRLGTVVSGRAALEHEYVIGATGMVGLEGGANGCVVDPGMPGAVATMAEPFLPRQTRP